MADITKAPQQLAKVYQELPPKRRIFALITVLLTIGSLVGLISWANRTDYKTIYTGLSEPLTWSGWK